MIPIESELQNRSPPALETTVVVVVVLLLALPLPMPMFHCPP